HSWFEQSRSSKDNPYRDYYYWKPEKPNNWKSIFGGDAWEYDERTGEYYLHLFTKKQPDLNWENPKVRQEVYDLMKFWLDKGVDGFRMDVIPFISKRLDFPDADFSDFNKVIAEVYANGPRLHEFLHEMNQEVMANYDMMTVGEGVGIAPDQALLYVGEDRDELNMFFHFDHMFIDHGPGGKFDVIDVELPDFKKVFSHWHHAVGEEGWINIYLDNHDFPRMVSRFGNDGQFRVPSAKVLATLILTMRGTPCIYQGSEMGMTNVAYDSLDDYKDVETLNTIREWEEAGRSLEELLPIVHVQGRDNVRTPIQWTDEQHAGFTTGQPWIKVNPNYTEINAQKVLDDPDSIYFYYQSLLKMRKEHSTWIYGDYEDLAPQDDHLFLYKRWDENHTYYVVLNFSEESMVLSELNEWGPVE
ncbi:MAG: alpha-amylase family glycosyl hydrolase, partial [Bacteroidota bacterium]